MCDSILLWVRRYIHWYNYENFQLTLKSHIPIEYRNVA
ncbi:MULTISPECIES: IS3 family transposase [unclassified Clostridium]